MLVRPASVWCQQALNLFQAGTLWTNDEILRKNRLLFIQNAFHSVTCL